MGTNGRESPIKPDHLLRQTAYTLNADHGVPLNRKERNRLIGDLYFEDGQTQHQIAELVGLSRQAIGKIITNAKSSNAYKKRGDKRKKITDKQWSAIVRQFMGGETQQSLADAHHVSQAAVTQGISRFKNNLLDTYTSGQRKAAAVKALVQDIRREGLHEPVTLYENKILDGRNRYRACRKAGVKSRYKTLSKKSSPLDYVLSHNLERRHLTASQRAMAAVKVLPLLAEEAKKRQQEHGGTAPGRKSLVAILPQVSENKSREQAGKMFGVSARYVSVGKLLAEEAPALARLVERGELTLAEAKKRQLATLKRGNKSPVTPKLGGRGGESAKQAAKIVGVSHGYISQMKRLKKKAPSRRILVTFFDVERNRFLLQLPVFALLLPPLQIFCLLV